MGCFPALKAKKSRNGNVFQIKRSDRRESSRPTALPEPRVSSRLLQSAPPSFRTRVKPILSTVKETNFRMRAFSAPSSLHGAHHMEYEEQEKTNTHAGSTKEQPVLGPQPLPLPSPRGSSTLKTAGSFKSLNSSGPLAASGPLPLPPGGSAVRNFSYEEISSACNNFSSDSCMSEGLSSVMYMASFGDETANSRKVEAIVIRLFPSGQGLREFVNEVNILVSLNHPNLCKLLGYHAREGSDQRMLVYERLSHGSLDGIFCGRLDAPPLDWNTRMKIALCAAQGLTFLHEEGPFQAMFSEFSTANIQIDKDFSAKLSGYGCIGHKPETEVSSNSIALANLSVETLERGLVTPKSNVWSFGVVLLELLTGRKNLDGRYPKEERNLVKWTRPFLADDCRLSLIMDPHLKGRFPVKAARTVANIAQKCLHLDPSERPTMRTIVESLKTIQDLKISCRFPLQEPGTVSGKKILRSPSLNGIVGNPPPRLNLSPSPPPRSSFSPSPPARPQAVPLLLPPRACSSGFSLEELRRQEARRSSSSSAIRRPSVEGF